MTGPAWSEFSPADFDETRAPRAAVARRAAEQDQGALFFTPTPVTRPARGKVAEELPGQGDLFGETGADQ